MTSVYMIRTQDIEPMVYSNLKSAIKALEIYASNTIINTDLVNEAMKNNGSYYKSEGYQFAEIRKLTVRTGV